jgi:hypothetical protein
MKAKFLLGVGALLGVAAIPIPTNAEEDKPTIQALYQKCKSNDPQKVYCFGFIDGIVTHMRIMAIAAEQMDNQVERRFLLELSKFCGHDASRGAMLQAFLNWAEKHPEKWSQYDGFGVVEALQETWPCR